VVEEREPPGPEQAPLVEPELGRLPTRELVGLMNDEDRLVPEAVSDAARAIAEAVDAVVDRLRAGGRLVYVGAGTSGGLAALDASECEATFSTPPGQVVALVAGEGLHSPLDRAAAEDDQGAGERAVAALGVGRPDAAVGISASGRTPFVVEAIRAAAEAGAHTIALVCAPSSELGGIADQAIVVDVGPEFIAGSTRLKAGTAQKLVLNTISTISMVRLGKTFGRLMVDVSPANDKLRARTIEIVATATGAPRAVAEDALMRADGDARVAIVSVLARIDPTSARERLDAAGDDIAAAVGA